LQSPVEPAKLYRKYLVEQNQFVSLKQKIERTPDSGKLLGAAHVYLWGDGLITRSDFVDIRRFSERIINDSNEPAP